jgi:23S rRNA (adenine2503-C2)-methyltransferase
MPINRKYNLNLLLGTLREELKLRKKQIVLFEYVMLSGVNDRSDISFGVLADCFGIL